jgi:hypothetical protein
MKEPEYTEGPETLENLKRLATDSTGSREKEKEAD